MTAAFLTIVCLLGQTPPAATSRTIRAEYDRLTQAERDDLKGLADRLTKAEKAASADRVRLLIEPPPPRDRTRFVPLDEVVAKPQKDATEADSGLGEARAIRDRTAKAMFALATKAADKPVRRFSLADRCLRAVLARDPDHAEARRLLGYLSYKGGWATPHAVSLLETGYVLHHKFGWVPGDWVRRLDAGELPGEFDPDGKPRSWLPAEMANALHREWQFAWIIDTAPHFRIESNVDLEEAVAFAQRLEAFHQMFLAEFADLIGPELPLAQRFARKGLQPTASPRKFLVSYFAQKGEYVDHLKSRFNQNEKQSLGFYLPSKMASRHNAQPRSYFYKDDANSIASHATLYHEASHQILFETAGKSNYDRNATNFWVWEGLGTYFETVELQEDGSMLVGGLVGPRVALARQKIIDQNDFVPISKFVEMGETKFRDEKDDAVYRNYAEAIALAVFLLNGEDGRYREAFLDYILAAYRGVNIKRSTLSDKLGKPYPTLDQEFLEFLNAK